MSTYQDPEVDRLFGHFPDPLKSRFKNYHAKNPHVFEKFVEFARLMQKAGHTKYSANAIIHRIRWEMDIKTTGSEFKLDDSFTPIYGRLAEYLHDDLKGFFEFRKTKKKKSTKQKVGL